MLEGGFSWQSQFLVILECHLSWQAHHLVKFWEIAKARNVVSFHTKCQYANRLDGEISNLRKGAGCGLSFSCSDHARIVLLLAAAFGGFFVQVLNLHFWRKSRGIGAFSGLGLLLLVCLAWWAQ